MNRSISAQLSSLCIAAAAIIGLAERASAESVVFGAVESSSVSNYGLLGGVMPFQGEQLGRGWYHKAMISAINFNFESDDRGRPEEVRGRVRSVEAGLGHTWQLGERNLDLSASVGYRRAVFKPFVPTDESTGGTLTLTPQLMAYTPLAGKFDADVLANYAIGLDTGFARLRVGAKMNAGWRVGLEGKRLQGRSFLQQAAGAFVSIPLRDKLNLELTVGRVKPEDDPSATYAGMGFSVVF